MPEQNSWADSAASPGGTETISPVPPSASPARTASPAPRGRDRARHLWRGAAEAVRSRWDILAVISAGGALGSLARWGLAVALPHPPGAFPWATFAANVSGCLLIGALMVLISDVWPPSRHLRPFLGVGVLGGYTTFSTYMLDTRALLVTGHAGVAAAYLGGSLAAGLAAVWAGAVVVRLAVRAARRRALRASGSDPNARRPAPKPSGTVPAAHRPGPAADSSSTREL